jgi:hypothetical protein
MVKCETYNLGSKNSAKQPPRLPPKLHVGLALFRNVEMQRAPCAQAKRDDAGGEDAEGTANGGLGLPSCRLICGSSMAEWAPHFRREIGGKGASRVAFPGEVRTERRRAQNVTVRLKA